MAIYHLLMILGVIDADICQWFADVVAKETESNRPVVILFTTEYKSLVLSVNWCVCCLWEEFYSSVVVWERKWRVFNFVERKCRRMNSEFIILCMLYECVSPKAMKVEISQFFYVLTLIMVPIWLLVKCNGSGISVILERERATKDCFRFCSLAWGF